MVARKGNEQGDADLLGHIVGVVGVTGDAGEPGSTVPEHHWADLAEERVHRSVVPLDGQRCQVVERRIVRLRQDSRSLREHGPRDA
ncbi:hypothetical protein Nans01_36950 [Nocardiopsis ansamitocini]|uniref:Uncharacterized protein n=1 Tax=Nocardiopsis ansamitocini TaxID=1670832 RepID=A0A9W6P970_9ACTN|nr:hypothetical protein Nans01_36950 [Nocardiopsis ansamitocini]